ncbi:MAG: biliverdin-producing heme oxygenase [Halomonas sp.]|nr:biliverdin-producing heme oxygenase [Halomonas sp.]TVP52146.1 MAG: biliverdin-producing heme oxygenase [Halomonas sp.]
MEAILTQAKPASTLPLSKQLKLSTHAAHERVDKAIMALSPFANLDGYKRFLTVQYQFQHHTAPLYQQADLCEWLERLEQRCRFNAVKLDAKDLSINQEELNVSLASPPPIDSLAAALGWLYVNEGSNLGAAFLLKSAAQLGLSANFGARHLAPSDSGRGLHWRYFTAQLDALSLSDEQKDQALQGARDAFKFVESLALKNL